MPATESIVSLHYSTRNANAESPNYFDSALVREASKPFGRFAIVDWHRRPHVGTKVLSEARGPRTELRMSPDDAIKAAPVDSLAFREVIEVPCYHYAALFERV
jgi:hypothetical protein